MNEWEQLLSGVVSGDKKSVSQLCNMLEDRRPEKTSAVSAALDGLWEKSLEQGHVIGITGPPGVGKSSLISRLIQHLRTAKKSVGVIAVDPSSKQTQGALLGDRVRLEYDAADTGVFVRSMASRGDYGGVSDRTFAGSIVLRTAFDMTLIETVGIGQSESEIAQLVDTTLLVIQPGSGDMLQYVKSGIMETPHVLLINKSDHVEHAQRTLHEVRAALGHLGAAEGEWKPAVAACSALTDAGIDEALNQLEKHREHLIKGSLLSPARERQALSWVRQSLARLYGSRGLEQWSRKGEIARRMADVKSNPFQAFEKLRAEFEQNLQNG
ncbi:ATP/GTP-binding protein [Candidatus Sumerlaeota bacterium]|nr:ATP/GTP-binding protein [Candidatus Sumerlaeota bacterium]